MRVRLLALVALAFLPIGLLVARLTRDERHAVYLRERDTNFRLLDVALAEHRDVTRAGRELLRQLAGVSEVTSGDPEECSHALRRVLATYSIFTSARRITRELQVDCASSSVPDSLADVSTEPPVVRAAQLGDEVSGYLMMGRLGQPVAAMVEPLRDPAGRIRGYLSLDAELHWFGRLVSAIPPDSGAMVALVDATGFIFARMPDYERFAGTRHPPNEALLGMLGRSGGFVEGVGLDERSRLYAYRTLPATNSDQVLLMTGVPTAVVYADANRHARENVTLTLLMLALGLGMAWVAADLFVLRDVRRLLGATERLVEGDLSVRVPDLTRGGELSELSEHVNDLARVAEERQRRFVLVGDSSPDCIALLGQDLRLEWANTVLLRRLGVTLEDLSGRPLTLVPLEQEVITAVERLSREVFRTGEKRTEETLVSTPAGNIRLELRLAPATSAAGETRHVLVMAREVREQIPPAGPGNVSNGRDGAGRDVDALAHEFNNLLTAIIGNAELSLRGVDPTGRVAADLTRILEISRRASRLASEFRGSSGGQPATPDRDGGS